MVVHGSIRRGIAVVVAAAALAAGAVESAQAAVYENPHLRVSARVNDLLSRMTLEEKIGQMTQTERDSGRRRPVADHDVASSAASCPAAARCRPRTRPRRGPTWSTASRRAALATRLHIPLLYGIDAVHGDGNMYGATVFPHNIGLGATRDPALVARGRARRRRGDARHRSAVGVRAVHLRGPRRPLGPHVRELRRGPRPGRSRWRRRSTASRAARAPVRPRPGAGDRQALRRRRRHHVRRLGQTGDYPIDQGVAVTSRAGLLERCAAPVRAGGPAARRRQRHAVVLQRRLDRGRRRQPDQDARQPGPDHRRAQGRAWASTAS